MGKQMTDPLFTITPVFRTDYESFDLCKGPCKVASFCALSVVLPAVLISIALLMRFVICGSYAYFLAPSDMMILDQGISTIWCQSERVKMNASFTAYLSNGEPTLRKSTEPLIFTKTLIIPDDHKEYWGFYLLKGSKFSLSTCAKFKGATVLVVQGRSHLHHCAYIGNMDSTGNSDERSDSNSFESQRLSPGSVRRLSNATGSREEMTQILNQIRSYIKSHPRGYNHLQRNLFGLFQENQTAPEEKVLQRRRRHLEDKNLPQFGKIYKRHARPHFTPGDNSAHEEDLDFNEPGLNPEEEVKVIDPVTSETPEVTSTDRSLTSIWNQHEIGTLNFSTGLDGSNSESESSFSSSEEALARCEGIVGIFNLNRSETCGLDNSVQNFNFNFQIKESGFYYFIFGSENEKTSNLMNVNLVVERVEYDLPVPLTNCTNVKKCQVDLDFGSNQKFVVSIPPAETESWEDVFYVETDCVPRTSIYLIFVIMVPLMILIFAFQ